MVKTRYVTINEPGQMTVEMMDLPPLKPNQVLVKAHQASVCGSERYFYRGINVAPRDEARGGMKFQLGAEHGEAKHTYPLGPLGHEGGGTIVEVGSGVTKYLGGGAVSVGDRVGSLIYPTYTDYWVTDIDHVQPIPEGVSFEVGCLYEPLGCAAWAARHAGVLIGDTVAVVGVGFAGNIIMQGAIRAGASKVIAIDVVAEKLEVAKVLGADVVVNATEEDALDVVNTLTKGDGVDVAVEAVGGTGIGIKTALDLVRHNGIISLYGDSYAPVNGFCFHRFHEDGLEIRNLNAVHYTRFQSIENMREAYQAVQRGVFNLDIILDHSVRYSLDEVPEVFAREAAALDTQDSLKTIIMP